MRLEYDLRQLYLDALAPQPGETVTFINDYPKDESSITEGHRHRAEMTRLWWQVMKDLSGEIGFTVHPILTIDLRNPAPGSFDADGYMEGNPVDLTRIMNSWGEKDIVVAINGPSITGELVRRLSTQPYRFASAPGVTIDFEGFKADYSKIPLRFEILTDKFAKAVACDMTFRLDGETWKCRFDLRGQRYLFKENGTAQKPGEFINLPSGCANIQPYPTIEDDIRGTSQTNGEIPALINDELVLFKISENRITEILGDSPEAAKERAHILESGDPGMAVITKLGLGINDEGRCNGTHVGDEKTMGMHWGYGPAKHFPDTIWAEHPVGMDMDLVYPGGVREPIFRNSMYTANLGELFF